ncbi:RagB/SusD family nutrient uptake outer membrane protein [Leptobacterium flavescens]|nr:RagB/SusD family nutrient uptake outer membrane protein [Leptobacterium flavescens]
MLLTDEVTIGFDSGGQGTAEYAYNINTNTGNVLAIWNNQYRLINFATRIIEAAEIVVPDGAAEQAQLNNIVAQAHALRAYGHFRLINHFSTNYEDDSALGVIALDEVPGIQDQRPRNTNGEVYALINSDLDAAAGLIDPTFSQNDPTFINTNFITAMRARLAAYRGQYTQADNFAAQALTAVPLAGRDDFLDIWTDAGNAGVIFKAERADGGPFDNQATGGGGWAGSLFAFVNATITGSPFMEMGRGIYNGLIAIPDDIREEAFVAPTSVIDPDYLTNLQDDIDIIVTQIYPGSEGQPLLNDLKIFRAAEMLFIRAEAAAEAGNLGQAAAFIQQLRNERYPVAQPLPNYANSQEAFADILHERSLELFAQAQRWTDIKRLAVRAGIAGVQRDPADCDINGVCAVPVTDFRFTLPIPQAEINANSVIAEQQNPGY